MLEGSIGIVELSVALEPELDRSFSKLIGLIEFALLPLLVVILVRLDIISELSICSSKPEEVTVC